MLPSGRVFDTPLEFYLHASDLFKAALSTYHDVFFTQLALSEPGVAGDTTILWTNVIKGLTDLGQYEDAYTALISAPHERLYVSYSRRIALAPQLLIVSRKLITDFRLAGRGTL